MRRRYPSRNILDECLLSSSKRSAELSRTGGFAQGMKSNDPLLRAWEKTLARKKDAAAIFDTRGEVLRTFHDIENEARAIESKMRPVKPGNITAIDIGNHQDWPSIF